MKKDFLSCFKRWAAGAAVILVTATTGMAGEPVTDGPEFAPLATSPAAADWTAPPENEPGCATCCPGTDCSVPRFWVSTDYLLWWVKGQTVPPLVTTGPLGLVGPGGFAGVVGQRGTAVVIGGDQDLGPLSGGRLTAGYWLDDCQKIGLEGSYFFLAQQSLTRSASSPTGIPPLSFPFFNVRAGGEDTSGIASPARGDTPAFGGSAALTTSTRLQGAELNGLANVYQQCGLRLGLLAGFRWLNLEEDLGFLTASPFLGQPNNIYSTSDQLATRNEFYGGQLGLRGEYCTGNFFFRATGKVALGDMHETVRIGGVLLTNDFTGNGAAQAFPGGYLNQTSNIGHYTRDHFAVVPEFNLSVGYQVTSRARVFAGYSFLYLSSVARPADQIDRVINTSQSVNLSGNSAATLNGTPRPAFLGGQQDFWAQGMNFGLELRF